VLSTQTFISLSCLTGRAALARPFSSSAVCCDYLAPFHSVHSAAASLYAQSFCSNHLLDGRCNPRELQVRTPLATLTEGAQYRRDLTDPTLIVHPAMVVRAARLTRGSHAECRWYPTTVEGRAPRATGSRRFSLLLVTTTTVGGRRPRRTLEHPITPSFIATPRRSHNIC
jgi:hypothetical protein